jgi:predicted nucleic acid-binding protein
MKRIFIDSSVLVAASASIKGASARILQYCLEGKIKGCLSSMVIGEARKNVFLKLSELNRTRLEFFLKKALLIIVADPKEEETFLCEQIINQKDAPILAAALNSQVSYLLTLDRKDFLQPKVLRFAKNKNIKIITPGDFVSRFEKNSIK